MYIKYCAFLLYNFLDIHITAVSTFHLMFTSSSWLLFTYFWWCPNSVYSNISLVLLIHCRLFGEGHWSSDLGWNFPTYLCCLFEKLIKYHHYHICHNLTLWWNGVWEFFCWCFVTSVTCLLTVKAVIAFPYVINLRYFVLEIEGLLPLLPASSSLRRLFTMNNYYMVTSNIAGLQKILLSFNIPTMLNDINILLVHLWYLLGELDSMVPWQFSF